MTSNGTGNRRVPAGRTPRIGLVLGAGGIQGGAWLTGGLDALARETGWDPATADVIVGTSAGSMIGSLVASGLPPWFMVAHSAGEVFDGLVDAAGHPAAEADRAAGAVFGLERALPPVGPGSWELALRVVASPRRFSPATAFASWMPRGFISTEPLEDIIRRVVPSGWSPHRNLWVVACDYATGRRVPFGRQGSPSGELAKAVAASCAIPGFYYPVEIGGRRYVDGGMYSTSNLDIVRNEELDLVICLNPTSSLHPTRAWNPGEWVARAVRGGTGRRLGSEARKLRDRGTDVVLIQPTKADLDAMGPNLMSRRNRHRTIEVARRSVAERLREAEVRDLLSGLPAGRPEKIHRPDSPPREWPDLIDLARSAT